MASTVVCVDDGGGVKMRNTCSFKIVNEIITNRQNSNRIVDLEKLLLSETEESIISTIPAVDELFSTLIKNKELYINIDSNEENAPETKYKLWLNEQYKDFKAHLLDYLMHENPEIQEKSLTVLMKFVEVESQYPLTKLNATSSWYFAKDTFQSIIAHLLEKGIDQVIDYFKPYVEFNDVKLYAVKAITEILRSNEETMTDSILQNAFKLLRIIEYPQSFQDDNTSDENNTFIKVTDSKPFVFKKKVFRRAFSLVWLQFLKNKLPKSIYTAVLKYLPKKVMPHLANPLLLTDFFTDLYNAGGIISLLALNGIFFLIQNNNLEYKDFYYKLYALFNPEILCCKFRARFFFLSDLFLSSTHLPAYLVASFIKRLARLCLFTTPDIILIILQFIENLMIRHPTLKVLIHQPDFDAIDEDPFDSEQQDPAVTNALESSLWEIKTLQSHWHPEVSRKAKFINIELTSIEHDMEDILELTVSDLIKREMKDDVPDIPMSYDKPSGFFQRTEDKMSIIWTL